MREIGRSTFDPSIPTGQILEESTRFGLVVGEQPPASSTEAPREPKAVGVVSVPKVGGSSKPNGELAQVRKEVLTVEAILTDEMVSSLSIELA
ncbi:hypothetical protein Nepgr_010454 [Nepenthes gracilis]|uniref:Uncharacterized protein n=1 Tax=Nepenthes gracilis TaxID=150966 RepID=A0AAD3SDE4_NEPGR|nr:hypothetical protein Nepgr_010454 [Nepenthes gracilis]